MCQNRAAGLLVPKSAGSPRFSQSSWRCSVGNGVRRRSRCAWIRPRSMHTCEPLQVSPIELTNPQRMLNASIFEYSVRRLMPSTRAASERLLPLRLSASITASRSARWRCLSSAPVGGAAACEGTTSKPAPPPRRCNEFAGRLAFSPEQLGIRVTDREHARRRCASECPGARTARVVKVERGADRAGHTWATLSNTYDLTN